MTVLDRAFIKAFAPASPRSAAAARRAESAGVNDSLRRHGRAIHPRHPAIESSQIAPLSTFSAATRLDEPLRAAAEVEHLVFPPASIALWSQGHRAWTHFIDALIERIGQGQKCLALTSMHRGEGRTTVCLATAQHLAARGLRGLVVDADFVNPCLASSCGLTSYTGWGDILTSELPLGEALIAAIDDGMTLMPWRGPAMRAAELAGSSCAATRFRTLRDHFDYVLVDTMNVAGQTTASELASFAETAHLDAVYVVQDVRSTLEESLVGACAKLRRAGLHVQGIIENFVPPAGNGELVARPSAALPAIHPLASTH